MASLILLTDYANESTTNDELFLKAENIMQEVPITRCIKQSSMDYKK